ncbi:MAG TPA: hypothetical protein VKY44_10080 [Flavobacterium sp.]|nr:hypothetical protein [Flavobacterium sp.]
MEKKQKILEIINIVSIILSIILVLGGIFKAIKRKMDLNNPIIPDNLVNNMVFQDILKTLVIFGVFLFQLKLYKRKDYLTSILFYFVAVFIYNLGYFFL